MSGRSMPEPLEQRSALAQRLIRARLALGLTQEQVARRAGLRTNYVTQVEADHFRYPDPDKLAAWGQALGIPYRELQPLPYARADEDAPTISPPPPAPSIFDDPAVPETVKRALRPFARRGADPAALRVAAAALAATLGKVPRSEMEREWGPTNAPDPDAPDLGDERNGHAS